MTLSAVAERSGNRFKASTLAGYERGEREISVSRFCELATLYGVPGDRLLGEVLAQLDPGGRDEAVIDLTHLSRVGDHDLLPVARYIHEIRTRRADYLTDTITLRSGDLAAISLATQITVPDLVRRLGPAIRLSRHDGRTSRAG